MRRDHKLERYSRTGAPRQKVRAVLSQCAALDQGDLADDLAGIKHPSDDRAAIRTIASGRRMQKETF